MTIKLTHDTDFGLGLTVADGKAKVKIKSGSALKVTEEGLDVTFPEQQEVPTAESLVTAIVGNPALVSKLLEALKGEEVHNLSGVSSGFLLKNN